MVFWATQLCFDLGWHYTNMTQDCVYVQMHLLHCDERTDTMTTLGISLATTKSWNLKHKWAWQFINYKCTNHNQKYEYEKSSIWSFINYIMWWCKNRNIFWINKIVDNYGIILLVAKYMLECHISVQFQMVPYIEILHLIMPLCFKSSFLNKSFLKMS